MRVIVIDELSLKNLGFQVGDVMVEITWPQSPKEVHKGGKGDVEEGVNVLYVAGYMLVDGRRAALGAPPSPISSLSH